MPTLHLPVRYYRDFAPHYDYAYETLSLPLERTAFLVVDVNGTFYAATTERAIVPALRAARGAGMHVSFVHNDLRLVADEGNIVFEIWGKTKGLTPEGYRKAQLHPPGWAPEYVDAVRPLPNEPDFPKWGWSGFRDTFLDQHLRALDIRTLICVGYSVRACFYGTIIDAVYRNYRVIALRDCVEAPEMPDTKDASLPEGGWINRIMVRQIEHLIGYTSTSGEFIEACKALQPAMAVEGNGKARR
ncbi:MAG: isochorismatase family protein [Anaerolineae bacterium]|nr:isochorismatase family protein [Anaerolineae bacterium]